MTASIMATSNSSQLSLRRFFSPSSSASVGTTATESKSDEELSESTVDKQPSEHYGRIERRSRARYCHGGNCGQECIFLHYICKHQVFHPPPFILMLAKTLVCIYVHVYYTTYYVHVLYMYYIYMYVHVLHNNYSNIHECRCITREVNAMRES